MMWLNQYLEQIDKFPRPNWDEIYRHVENNLNETNQNELWNNIARAWMSQIISKLPKGYSIHESDNFIIVTSESDRYVSIFQTFLENTLNIILRTLYNITSDNGFGKHVVLIFDDIDSYYSYMSYFYSEDGIYGLSSGVYLNKGYGHFAFPSQELSYAESIAAHEMTHALVSHLPIPAWLDEGMAVNIENFVTGSSPLSMNDKIYAQHQSFWGDEEIQEFWSGESFSRIDEGQSLSYQLAQFAVNTLSKDYDAFIRFVNKAHYSDGGESAASEIYNGSLGDLITQLFGEGNWTPNPDTWTKAKVKLG